MKKLLSSIWPSLIWTLFIFILLVMPTTGLEGKDVNEIPNVDKIVHVVLFSVFSFLWFSFFDSNYPQKRNLIFPAIFIMGSLYGLGMEFVQKYFTERNFSLIDALADTIGILIVLFIKKSPYGNRGRNQN